MHGPPERIRVSLLQLHRQASLPVSRRDSFSHRQTLSLAVADITGADIIAAHSRWTSLFQTVAGLIYTDTVADIYWTSLPQTAASDEHPRHRRRQPRQTAAGHHCRRQQPQTAPDSRRTSVPADSQHVASSLRATGDFGRRGAHFRSVLRAVY